MTRYNCPRCGGLMRFCRDEYGEYYSCYSCARIVDLTLKDAPPEDASRRGQRAYEGVHHVKESPTKLAARLAMGLLDGGMTRKQLADACGVDLATVTNWRCGAKFPATTYLPRLKELAKEITSSARP